jgi:D-amino-acid dehydrogenase
MATEPFDCEWQPRGLLFPFRTQAGLEHHDQTAELLRTSFGTLMTRFAGDEVRDLEPALKRGLAGGWHYPADAHLRPDKLMSSWRSVLGGIGVTIREDCEVKGFVRDAGRAVRVITPREEIPADAFVVAAGALTPWLNRELGCKIPIQPGKGYSITMARPKLCPQIPMIFEEHRVAITPFKSGYRVGSTMEFAGYDDTLNPNRLELLRNGARLYLHDPLAEPVSEEWWGWRPMIYHGRPVIGKVPAYENVLVAAGHGMLGLSMSTGTGKLVSELLSGESPHIDPSPYAATRF